MDAAHPDNIRSQAISSHGFETVCSEYSSFSTKVKLKYA